MAYYHKVEELSPATTVLTVREKIAKCSYFYGQQEHSGRAIAISFTGKEFESSHPCSHCERENSKKLKFFMAVMVDIVEEQLPYHPWVNGLSPATPVSMVKEK
jgi:hypothetical protein